MSKTIINTEFYKEVVDYFEKKTDYYAPEDLAEALVKSTLEVIGNKLGTEVSEEEEAVVEIPGYLEFKASYRESEGSNNFAVSITAQEEIKERVKNDNNLENFIEDNDDEE